MGKYWGCDHANLSGIVTWLKIKGQFWDHNMLLLWCSWVDVHKTRLFINFSFSSDVVFGICAWFTVSYLSSFWVNINIGKLWTNFMIILQNKSVCKKYLTSCQKRFPKANPEWYADYIDWIIRLISFQIRKCKFMEAQLHKCLFLTPSRWLLSIIVSTLHFRKIFKNLANCFAHICNQHWKCIKMSTNMHIFGPVVLI